MKVTDEQIVAALFEASGNVREAAKALEIHHSTIYKRLQNDALLQANWNTARNELLDMAESVIKYHLEKNNLTAAIYTTKTLGRSRGWDENPQRSGGPTIGSVTINIVEGDSGSDNNDAPMVLDNKPNRPQLTE